MAGKKTRVPRGASESPESRPGAKPRVRYRNPPIQEALCELRFEPTHAWTPTLPSAFYERIRSEYQGLPRTQDLMQAGFQVGSSPAAASFRVQPGGQKTQFPNPDNTRMVALGPHVLSVHILRPYEGWVEDFRPRLVRALEVYRDAVGEEPIRRIGLRYVNRIVISKTQIELGDYFRLQPTSPPGWPDDLTAMSLAGQFTYNDQPIEMRVLFATEQAGPGSGLRFLLDLDFFRAWEQAPLPFSDALAHVDDMRAREREAFEAVLTDQTRALFGRMD